LISHNKTINIFVEFTNLPVRKILKNIGVKIAMIVLLNFTCMSSPGSIVFFNLQITEAAAGVSINEKQIPGGGNGSIIICPDRSSRPAISP
jgi:hypothetical protein